MASSFGFHLLLVLLSSAVLCVQAEDNETEMFNMSGWSNNLENVTGEVVTALAQSASAGDTVIYLADVTGLVAGMELTIAHPDGTYQETFTIVSVTVTGRRLSAEGRRLAAGSVTLSGALANSYPQGATIAASMSSTGAAGNDPVVWFGKESREFWLPVGQLTPIIQTPDLQMYASTFVGSPREQWIDRVVVTNNDGFRFADVRIKKNINSFNRSAIPQDGFESMELTLGMAQSPLKTMPKVPPGGSNEAFKRMDLWMVVEPLSKVFNWLPWHVDQVTIGKARREAVVITSPDARFLIISSPATEYSGDFSYLSVEYAHLDIHILDMKNKHTVRGLLPELWGIQKMSNRTKELTCPPWSKDAPKTEKYAVDVDAEWNRRFFTV